MSPQVKTAEYQRGANSTVTSSIDTINCKTRSLRFQEVQASFLLFNFKDTNTIRQLHSWTTLFTEMQAMLYVINLKDPFSYSKKFLFEFGFKEKVDITFSLKKRRAYQYPQYLS